MRQVDKTLSLLNNGSQQQPQKQMAASGGAESTAGEVKDSGGDQGVSSTGVHGRSPVTILLDGHMWRRTN